MFFKLSDAFHAALDRTVSAEVEDRIRRVPTKLNEYGFDPFGFNPDVAKYLYSAAYPIYKHYFRVETHGAEHLPGDRVIVAANHSGVLPWDGLMVALSMLMEADPPRLARGMAERWFPTLPVFSPLMQRMGHVLGDPQNCRELLGRDEAILVFPEGVRGIGKTIWEAYELQEFGTGFVRLALETGAPIVPCAVVGAEEQMPSVGNVTPLARLTGFPYVPVTPFFPALGPLGLLPLPVRYRVYYDEPIHFDGDARSTSDEDVDRAVEIVKSKIHRLIQYGLETREGVFS